MKALIFIFVLSFVVVSAIQDCNSDTWSNCDLVGLSSNSDYVLSENFYQTVPVPDNSHIEEIALYFTNTGQYGTPTLHVETAGQSYEIAGSPFVGDADPNFFGLNYVPVGPTNSFSFWIVESGYKLAASTDDVCQGEAHSNGKRGTNLGDPSDIIYTITLSCAASSSGDPHFFGFKGQKYDVMGESYEIYNIITAPYLQVNSRFTPYYKTASQLTPTGTMIGFKFHGQKFHINSNLTEGTLGQVPISMKSDWSVSFGDVTLSNVASNRMYKLTIDAPDIAITFIRKVYMVTGLEPQFHFDYEAKTKAGIKDVHGLLGQTWELKEFTDKPLKFLDGFEDDYRIISNDIFGDDFKFNKYENM